MAKILSGTVEVISVCALKWHALLSYMKADRVLEDIVGAEDFATAEGVAKLVAGNIAAVDATKLEEYYNLLEKIKAKDTYGAALALDKFRGRVVPSMIEDVVDCECERRA